MPIGLARFPGFVKALHSAHSHLTINLSPNVLMLFAEVGILALVVDAFDIFFYLVPIGLFNAARFGLIFVYQFFAPVAYVCLRFLIDSVRACRSIMCA